MNNNIADAKKGDKIKVNPLDYIPILQEDILEVTKVLNYFAWAKDSKGVEYIVNLYKVEKIKDEEK